MRRREVEKIASLRMGGKTQQRSTVRELQAVQEDHPI